MFTVKQSELISKFKHGELRRINLLEGSVRSGKTWISLVLWALWVGTMPPGGSYLMVAKTLTSLRRNCLDLLYELVGDTFQYNLSTKEGRLFGRRIYLEGVNDVRAESKIRGMTLQGAYCDELTLFTEDFFSMLLSRLSMSGAKLIATTNPDSPSHWLMENYIKRQDDLDMLVDKFLIDDNTFLDRAYVENLKREYTGVFYDRFILGLWRVADGLCYQQFADNPAAWLVDAPDSDIDFITVGVDFGGNKSLTTFVATAFHRGYRALTVVADYHIVGQKGDIDADRVGREYVAFIRRLQSEFPTVQVRHCFADSEAQYLINSMIKASRVAGIGVPVGDSAKNAIVQRIICCNTMLNLDKLRIMKRCKLVIDGLRCACWDSSKAKDTRLDNFSSDIDILDAFEYSWERYMPRLIPRRGETDG